MKVRFDLGPPAEPVPSPCVGVCTLDDDGRCIGCARTGEEIAAWPSLTEAQRRALLDVLDARALGREPEGDPAGGPDGAGPR